MFCNMQTHCDGTPQALVLEEGQGPEIFGADFDLPRLVSSIEPWGKSTDIKLCGFFFWCTAPSLEARAQKARSYKKAPGASGRLRRTEAGDWIWSSDSEEEGGQSNDESDDEPASQKPPNHLIEKGGIPFKVIQSEKGAYLIICWIDLARASDTHLSEGSTSSCSEHEESIAPAPPAQASDVAPATIPASEPDPINLVLRMRYDFWCGRERDRETLFRLFIPPSLALSIRNHKRELNDIRFEFTVGRDSADGIASELVAAGEYQ